MRITQTYESVCSPAEILAAQAAGAITRVNGFNTGNPDLDTILGRLNDPVNEWDTPNGISPTHAKEGMNLHARAQYMGGQYIRVDTSSSKSPSSYGDNSPGNPDAGTVRAELVVTYTGMYNECSYTDTPQAIQRLIEGTNFKLKPQPK